MSVRKGGSGKEKASYSRADNENHGHVQPHHDTVTPPIRRDDAHDEVEYQTENSHKHIKEKDDRSGSIPSLISVLPTHSVAGPAACFRVGLIGTCRTTCGGGSSRGERSIYSLKIADTGVTPRGA